MDYLVFSQTFVVAFASLFALMDPLGNAVIYAGLTTNNTRKQRRKIAVKGVFIATMIILTFILLGDTFLERMGISLAALRTSGGILLLLLGIDMVFARHSGGGTATKDETSEAQQSSDISVFPLATPLIAGPGPIGICILMMASAQGDWNKMFGLLSAIGVLMLITLSLLLMASQIQKILGLTALNAISRILGILITALSVQFIFDGLKDSGLLPV
jgi:multiple antibiotic resistance protein